MYFEEHSQAFCSITYTIRFLAKISTSDKCACKSGEIMNVQMREDRYSENCKSPTRVKI